MTANKRKFPPADGWPKTPITPADQPLIDKIIGWIRGEHNGSEGVQS